jgi:Tfp pilus assembly protein PilX
MSLTMHALPNLALSPRARRQLGAALPVALILLTILMLLAVAGMRSAGLGFIMAGNEQYRQKAFVAAEAGIERAVSLGTFNPESATATINGAVPNAATDTYVVNIQTQLSGQPQGAIFGSSWNAFSTFHFEVQSTGSSVRNATTTHNQGVAVIAPSSLIITGAGGL